MKHYNLIRLFLIILLLVIVAILITDSFFIHQAIFEFENFNQELIEKFEYFEKTQQEKFEELENTLDKKLTTLENNQKLMKKNPGQDPTTTEWIFVIITITLCFYAITGLGFGK